MHGLRSKGLKSAFALCLACTMLFAWVVPAQALDPFPILPPIIIPPIFFLAQGVNGQVVDIGTTAPIKGIIVSAYKDGDGSYVYSSVTDATGHYSIWLPAGTYRVQFRDPAGRYGEQWSGTLLFNPTPVSFATASAVTVNTSVYTTVNLSMKQAGSIKTIVRRVGHPLTVLPGKFVIVQQTYAGSVAQWSGNTGGDGAITFGGFMPGVSTPTYKESAVDPSGQFYSNDATTTWLPITAGLTTAYVDMFTKGSSVEITPTVPTSAKTNRSANVSFTVTGGFKDSKTIANGKQIKILAVKGSKSKTFAGTIKSNHFSAKVKLSKGTWTLYSLFTGNSVYAPNDSLTGKTFKVK